MRSAGIVSVAIALSRVTGLVRERVMAHYFGAGEIYDAFLVGISDPESDARSVCGRRAFVGLRADLHALSHHQRKPEARELYNLVATALFVIVGRFACWA